MGKEITDDDLKKLNKIKKRGDINRKSIADMSHVVINTLVNNLIKTTQKNLKSIYKDLTSRNPAIESEKFFAEYESLDLPFKRTEIVAISGINSDKFTGLIKGAVHHSKNVERMNAKGKYIIRKLFEAYYANPQQLPDGPILHLVIESGISKTKSIDVLKKEGVGKARILLKEKSDKSADIYFQCLLMRRICDHIASMTDRYAIEEYNNLYG